MQVRVKHVLSVIVCMVSMIVTGCGSSSKNDTGSPTAKTGHFTFGPVEGMTYTCNGMTGKTGSDGSYKYVGGQDITFSIGNLVLGTTTAKSRITPYDFNDITQVIVTNLCTFLLTIDDDRNPDNGITVSQTLTDLLSKTKNSNGEAKQDRYSDDVCEPLEWEGNTYRMYYDGKHTGCTAQAGETLVHVVLDNRLIDKNIFSQADSKFETDPSLANLLLACFAGQSLIYTIGFDNNPASLDRGWYSNFWGLPDSFWEYQRDLADKLIKIAYYTPLAGTYKGAFSGSSYSGNLSFGVTINHFYDAAIYGAYDGNTCNGQTGTLYGTVAQPLQGYRTGTLTFNLSQCNLYFTGLLDADTGTVSGTFSDPSGTVLGTFSCRKLQ